jgi:hypothetical protein
MYRYPYACFVSESVGSVEASRKSILEITIIFFAVTVVLTISLSFWLTSRGWMRYEGMGGSCDDVLIGINRVILCVDRERGKVNQYECTAQQTSIYIG